MTRTGFFRFSALLLIFASVAAIIFAVRFELTTSTLQSRYFSELGKQISYKFNSGPSSKIRFPSTGPYDIRLGYTRIPSMARLLIREGYEVTGQAEMSPRMLQLTDLGVFTPYNEKSISGLRIYDLTGEVLYDVKRPSRTFSTFDAIPQLVTNTLLFIENRELLDAKFPKKNPAVEWDRLGKAVLEKSIQKFYPERSAPGGSTIATQLEKFRHAFEGRTTNAQDKLQQMLSAALRAYLDGPDTSSSRKQILLDYVNSIPLAALPGYGEVTGLKDGLWAWYGIDDASLIDELKGDLSLLPEEKLKAVSLLYKQILSLFIAHRRPSEFLLTDVSVLNYLVDEHLQMLASHGLISEQFRDLCLAEDLHLRSTAQVGEPVSFLNRKAANAIRTRLLDYLSIPTFYELDLTDLEVNSTLDKKIQDSVSEVLGSLKDPEQTKKLGLTSARTLDRGDPAKVIYSVTLYEHRNGQNLLRIQTDNYDKPFSINEGTRLDLGSTAKLRTLTSYLEIVSSLFELYSRKSKEEIVALGKAALDPISTWAFGFLANNPEPSLEAMCEAAMERTYSASPAETFFTGGGVHTFSNFKREDNGRVVNIWEALRSSINLPFIRLMRDIVRYRMSQIPGSPTRIDDKMNDDARKGYLAKFADKEGSYFLEQFYQKYKNLSAEEILPTFVGGIKPTPVRLATIFRYVYPKAPLSDFAEFLDRELSDAHVTASTTGALFENYGPERFPLNDQGFIAKVHPLELWLVKFLIDHPKAPLSQALRASAAERQEVYGWLFTTKHRKAQDIRIRTLVEMEAFLEIHRGWKRLGYPFDNMVPSLASAIGSSGDRPAALAELIGIILNDGVKYPNVRISQLRFAKDTPYETLLRRKPSPGERLLRPEVAKTLRKALTNVVENGTARRVSGAFVGADGKPLVVGGKTGTGDHRFETFGKGGALISSRVVSRTATFVFFIGEKFFGVVSAHVAGEQAAAYDFTSALAAELLKILSPQLTPLINSPQSDEKS